VAKAVGKKATTKAQKASYRRFVRQINAYYKTHPKPKVTKKATAKPTKTTAPLGGELGMCAFTAAGLVVGGLTDRQLVDAYLSVSPEDTGASIPEAVRYLGRTPEHAVTFTPGTMLALAKPNRAHAVVVDAVTEGGLWVTSWGMPYFLGWDFVDEYGEDAWLAR
jgi:hypothetical protein